MGGNHLGRVTPAVPPRARAAAWGRPGERTRLLVGLLIPAGGTGPLWVVAVADRASAISDTLGGVLLDDPYTWCTAAGGWVSAYLGEGRHRRGDNPRLSVVATRLGVTDRRFHAATRGEALLLGTALTGVDRDLPEAVLAEVARCGLEIRCRPPAPARG